MKDTKKDIADWHRNQAKELQAMAKKHLEMAAILDESKSDQGALGDAEESKVVKVVTLDELEASLDTKGGRIAHLASRLKTTPQVIENLLSEPDCRYEIGRRGFIYAKQK